ncbi:MAG: hypothetical protein M3292_06170 [Actinomycetota bacterium]|nr:hypothetical protein [Actinomycetota bacterium]
MVIVEPPSYLQKQTDGVTGLALIAIDSSDAPRDEPQRLFYRDSRFSPAGGSRLMTTSSTC